MKNFIILIIISIFSLSSIAQIENKPSSDSNITPKKYKPKNWSLSSSTGFITIPTPNLGNNIWGSVNLGYSKNNWSSSFWVGSNYWIEGRQPDLRLGISTTYTFLKW
jgi:hypothetical protein